MCLASERIPNCFSHGLRTPNEDFFHHNYKLLSLARQFGLIKFRAFWVLSVDLSLISTHFGTGSRLSMFSIISTKTKPLYPSLKRLGFEFGPQRVRDLALACP